MAERRKKTKAAEVEPQSDPRAPLDPAALVSGARSLLQELAADLLARADGSAQVTAALQARHREEKEVQKRTADAYPEWRRAFVEQVAAAWFLSCVFVRTLEDRGLLGKNRIAGPGADDSRKAFLALAPSLSDREYLLTVFRELAGMPAAADLFDPRHNPVWLLAPSAEKAQNLVAWFQRPTAEAPAFRFGGGETRFLGDLYQDLSEDVRKRYALLQTPGFIERFILDRTLDPAIEKFGLDDTTLIDPTCGSGHFLLGAFERLFDARLRKEPGLSKREAAIKAIEAVAGADINPYAIAIARFRLTLAFMDKCDIRKLKDAPRLPLHLAVADSLLYNPHVKQQSFAYSKDADPRDWKPALFSLEDPVAARDALFPQYAVVVGNPPYITVKDPTLRERYRKEYEDSAAGKYSLAAPFAERFFQQARSGGLVGMITANSFMKREFGKALIEKYLPKVNLELIVNTSGAYIPGHGTPTVLLFGTHEAPKGADVIAVLASRGEPSTPEDPEQGLVWSSILKHWNEVGFENEYISVARVAREALAKHPWSLGGGGAGELKELLENKTNVRLKDIISAIGVMGLTGEDEAYIADTQNQFLRNGVKPSAVRELGIGENIRDWSMSSLSALYPHDEKGKYYSEATIERYLWPFRTNLRNYVFFGKIKEERGMHWAEWGAILKDKLEVPFSITFAFVATHNHFVLDRGGKVFNRSAPIIKLPETATEDDHLALLAYLNSSTACFWMKQAMMNKGGSGIGRGVQDEAWEARFEFDGTKLGSIPVPGKDRLADILAITRRMLEFTNRLQSCMGDAAIALWKEPGVESIGALEPEARALLARMCGLQEELDWIFYEVFGLLEADEAAAVRKARDEALAGFPTQIDPSTANVHRCGLHPGHRPFEILLWREATSGGTKTAWFERNRYETPDTIATAYSPAYQRLLQERVKVIQKNPNLRVLEQPEYKRRWTVRDWKAELHAACERFLLDGLERVAEASNQIQTRRALVSAATTDARYQSIADHALGASHDFTSGLGELMANQSVPFVAQRRYSDSGLEKHRQWEMTWSLQRREDRGEKVEIPVPPKYGREDYASPTFWSLRGKLDVPKERFISYPGCESDEDGEPVYGWAGWDHLQRAVALAGLYQDRRREGWKKERLMPMLAGLVELLPWLEQWHSEPSAELGGERPSDQFAAFIHAECAEHGWTHDDLRAWRRRSR